MLSSCLQNAAVFVCAMQQGFQRIISPQTRTEQDRIIISKIDTNKSKYLVLICFKTGETAIAR